MPMDSDDNTRVRITIEAGVAEVRLDRADKRNALDGAMFAAIARAGERLADEPGVRAVVLCGEGPSFCAGLDFSGMAALAAGGDGLGPQEGNPGALQPGGLTHLGQQVAWTWEQLPVPVIAAVHGHALGGGLQIALGADIRIAHPETQLSVREVFWGLVPDMTGTHTLSKLVRPDVARELTYTARVVRGTEAFELGLVTRLSETPIADAHAVAAQIAANSPDAVRGAKALFHRIAAFGAAEQFAAERREIGALVGTPHQAEAVRAGMEQRPGQFG